jgi:hypothetical protein
MSFLSAWRTFSSIHRHPAPSCITFSYRVACLSNPTQAAARELGLELGKSVKLEWHRAAHARTRCLRVTAKEEKAVRAKLAR